MSNLTLFQELEELLRPHSQYTSEDGVMLKNSIVEASLQLRPDLLKLILSNEKLKANFFTEVENLLVFDKVRFQKFVMNKRFLPDSYTSFKNKIGLTTDEGDFLAESREVVLSWPYKDCVLEGGQTKEDAKRNEVFWNEILAPDEINRLTEPKVLTNFKKFDADGEHNVESISKADNLIIKGNNLLALHSLKKTYAGQVKLIYIDPPYNTDSVGFNYNDSFNHSAWLTFMRNRLEIAQQLLSENGTIWISIDSNESHYLKVIADEVFRRENFIEEVIWQRAYSPVNLKKTFSRSHDYILIYAKNLTTLDSLNGLERTDEANERYKNPDNDYRGPWKSSDLSVGPAIEEKIYEIITPSGRSVYPPEGRCWVLTKERFEEFKQENRIWFGENGSNVPSVKRFASDVKDSITPMSLWTYQEVGHNQDAKKEVKLLHTTDLFETPKPEKLIQRIIQLGSQEGDIILDFFLGSATTTAVAHKMGRRYIGIEQMDYIETVALERLKKVIGKKSNVAVPQQAMLDFVAEPSTTYQTIDYDQGGISKAVNWQGGGSFIYCELAKANQEFADKILASDNKEKLTEIWKQMQETGFLSWKVNPKTINENTEDFASLSIEDTQKFLLEALDKNLLYIPYSEIDNQEFGISKDDKQLNAQFYGKA